MYVLNWHFNISVCYICASIGFFVGGCQTIDDTEELPYTERLVISGEARSDVVNVVVERTLRLSEAYDQRNARLIDADVRLTSRGISHRLFDPVGNGVYFSPNIPLAEGDECELIVQWRGKEARARTRLPARPRVDSMRISRVTSGGNTYESFSTTLTPSPRECYVSSWSLYAGRIFFGEPDSRPRTTEDAENDGKLHFVTRNDYSGVQMDSVKFFIEAYDMPYYEFYISRGNIEFVGLPVSFFSAPFSSNVTGDGVGLFVGRSTFWTSIRLR
jgi:hypothetical protein